MNDTQRLNWLEQQNAINTYTGRCLFRMSTTGRGWRLMETSQQGASRTVREAIDQAMLIDCVGQVPQEDTCVREVMARFEYSNFLIRCWVPYEDIQDNESLEKFIEKCKTLFNNYAIENNFLIHTMSASEFLCRQLNMNACEVICKSDMCGAVFYREWP